MSDAPFRPVSVFMRDGSQVQARATGNNVAWNCLCGRDRLPLLATRFPRQSETVCPSCGSRYKFKLDEDRVDELG